MKKKILSLVIVVILCITLTNQTFAIRSLHQLQSAQAKPSSGSSGKKTVVMENESMNPPSLRYCDAALLVDLNSGRILYGKNSKKRVYPASTTKIMTAILAIEMGDFDEVVSASAKAIEPITMYDSQIGILVGEKLTLEQLVHAMMIPSANDAANVVAVHLAGSIDAFAELMNQKAKELGMKHTHFVNACGMHDNNHYTTVEDLALLAQYAMKNEAFRSIVKQSTYKIAPTNKYDTQRELSNTNLFLSSDYHRMPFCNGIKTGHTSEAGYCLVSSANYKSRNLLSIVMGCDNEDLEEHAYSYLDSKELFDFGIKNYKNLVVAAPDSVVHTAKVKHAKRNTELSLTVDTPIQALVSAKNKGFEGIEMKLKLPEKLYAPITKGTVLGTVTYTYRGTKIGTAKLVAANDVERSIFLYLLSILWKIISSPFFFVPVILILLILINRNRRKKLRQKRLEQKRARNEALRAQMDSITRNNNSRYRS